MALTGDAIERAVADGRITFEPFSKATLNPNSVDIHLGGRLIELTPARPDIAQAREIVLPAAGVILEPGALYLGASRERFGSEAFAPLVHGKSNIARAGLFIHINGDLVDVGVIDHVQLQLAPLLPIRVTPGMAIGQVTFWPVAR